MIKGDINKDGVITNEDLTLLKRILDGSYTADAEALQAADMDNSGGNPTVEDLLALQKLLEEQVSKKEPKNAVKKSKATDLLNLKGCCCADANQDGEIDMVDADILLKLLQTIIDKYLKQPKNNKLIIPLKEFENAVRMTWFVTTQAAYNVHVYLRDNSRPYINNGQSTTDPMPPLSYGSAEKIGKNLVLEISIPQSEEIRALPSMHTIITETGKVVGHSFTCCGEDWKDNDYNDFYIHIVSWNSRN